MSQKRADPPDSDFEIGQWVRVEGFGRPGRIETLAPERGEAQVIVGGIGVKARLEQLQPADPPEEPAPSAPSRPEVRTAPDALAHEIDLHGLRVEEALDRLDKFIDTALVHRLTQVKVIHGLGTGKLRKSVREYLERHPRVAGFNFGDPIHGGLGTTMVQLE